MLGKLKLQLTFIIIVAAVSVASVRVYATTTSSSTHYQVDQVLFGTGGDLDNSSTNYQAQTSVGETGIGNYTSTNYQAYAGFNTTSDPYLEIEVTAANLNLGVLSDTSTATANATFYVRAWNALGYIVQTDSPPPTNAGYPMHTNSTPAVSSVGTEQFGMNLVSNMSPITFGMGPQQTTSFSYGSPGSNYGTTNEYAYNNGDTIAQSTESTSSTVYTISYIFNISSSTPGGQYIFNQNLVATGNY